MSSAPRIKMHNEVDIDIMGIPWQNLPLEVEERAGQARFKRACKERTMREHELDARAMAATIKKADVEDQNLVEECTALGEMRGQQSSRMECRPKRHVSALWAGTWNFATYALALRMPGCSKV